jgi:hypothetical protein
VRATRCAAGSAAGTGPTTDRSRWRVRRACWPYRKELDLHEVFGCGDDQYRSEPECGDIIGVPRKGQLLCGFLRSSFIFCSSQQPIIQRRLKRGLPLKTSPQSGAGSEALAAACAPDREYTVYEYVGKGIHQSCRYVLYASTVYLPRYSIFGLQRVCIVSRGHVNRLCQTRYSQVVQPHEWTTIDVPVYNPKS